MVEEVVEVAESPGDDARQRGFDHFCRAQYPVLLGVLTLVLRDRSSAEDLAQETLARVWLRWDRVRELERADLWARRVALNLASSWWRRQRSASRAAGRQAPPPPVGGPEPVDNSLLAAVRQLPPRQRAAIALRYLADMALTDAAEVMGCREGTVKALTAQGIATLRQSRLISQGDDND
jgi:RNA polymerase sigma-70 factor (sigma-E family)